MKLEKPASKWFAEIEKELRARIDSLHTDARNDINDTVQSVHNSAEDALAVSAQLSHLVGS